jgi:hypothetical protein
MVAFAFVVTLIALCKPASAQTQQDIDACTPDAFRLCEQAIPDREKVKACLIANRRQLSPDCRRVFQTGRRSRD